MFIRFRITNVDEYGFNGRDNHPSKEDIGLVVTPVKQEMWICNDDDINELFDVNNHEHRDVLRDQTVDGMAGRSGLYTMTMWTVITSDGRVLDMMDFELELSSCGDAANGMQFQKYIDVMNKDGK